MHDVVASSADEPKLFYTSFGLATWYVVPGGPTEYLVLFEIHFWVASSADELAKRAFGPFSKRVELSLFAQASITTMDTMMDTGVTPLLEPAFGLQDSCPRRASGRAAAMADGDRLPCVGAFECFVRT